MQTLITFKTKSKVPKMGLMLVGLTGNNGSTVTAAILANKNKMEWMTKEGKVNANYFGSITQASTLFIGADDTGKDIYLPMNEVVPMVHPNDIVLDGWDISGLNLADAMARAKVLDYGLQQQLRPLMEKIRPRKGIYNPDFIAANQNKRADNLIETTNKAEQIELLRQDIRDFKKTNKLDTVVILWTANTERFTELKNGVHDKAENLIAAIKKNEPELAPSLLYAVASILEGVRDLE